jgi:hypothetical protein
MMGSGAQTVDMVMALLNGQVVAFTSENSKMIVETVKARSLMLMALSTRVNGKTTKEMGKVLSLGLITQSMLECLETI